MNRPAFQNGAAAITAAWRFRVPKQAAHSEIREEWARASSFARNPFARSRPRLASRGAARLDRDMAGAPPNILWIVTTQWRAQALGCAGDPNARTPCLDALAAESVNYTQAVTPHPFGPFARAALLTGVPSPQNGVREYFDPLPAHARTIAHELNERGYETAFIGKWHLGERARDAPLVGEAHARTLVPPERRGGFQFWEGFESGFLLNDPWLHGTRMPEPVRVPGYQSDVICERAAGWIVDRGSRISNREDGDPGATARRWFAVVSLEPPHPPYDAPAAGFRPGDPDMIALPGNVPRGGGVETKARTELAGYYAHLEATDRALGGLLRRIDRSRTIVMFTSVHGDMHGAHGLFRKGWPHEESVRVPLLVRGVAQDRSSGLGISSSELVSLVDLPSWTLSWAEGLGSGLQSPNAGLQTRKTKPHAPGAKLGSEFQRLSMPSAVALPHQCDRAWFGVRTSARKLILNTDGSPWLFYDLERDPLELRNLVAEPERAAEIAGWRERALAGGWIR
jgi:arylsulfatase A-like enzyme